MNSTKYEGTGSPSGILSTSSSPITVTPSTTYILSGYIDATHVTTGSPQWRLTNASMSTVYGSVSQTAGTAGRVSTAITIPGGVTSVLVVAHTNNCTVTSGQLVSWFAPQLEQNTVSGLATHYKTNAFDDTAGTIRLTAHAPQVQAITSTSSDSHGSFLAADTFNADQIRAGQVEIQHFIGDLSGDTTAPIFNGSTKQLTQGVHDPTVLLGSVTGIQLNLAPDSNFKFKEAYWTLDTAVTIEVAG